MSLKSIAARILAALVARKTQAWASQPVETQKAVFHDLIKKAKLGAVITLNKILLFKKSLKIQLGKPFLSKSILSAKILQDVKGPKFTVLKTKPKKNYTRVQGHRQKYSRVQLSV